MMNRMKLVAARPLQIPMMMTIGTLLYTTVTGPNPSSDSHILDSHCNPVHLNYSHVYNAYSPPLCIALLASSVPRE